jgi:ankyrin repeat protein
MKQWKRIENMFESDSPLINAILAGNPEAVQMLLQQGADTETSDKHGITPLFAITRLRDAEQASTMLSLLIEAGVGLSSRDRFDRSALWFALHDARTELIQRYRLASVRLTDHITLADFINSWPRHYRPDRASYTDYWQVFEWLLQENPPLDLSGDKGRSALQIACSENLTEVALRLIDLGAAVDFRSQDGRLPLVSAASNGSAKLLQALLKSGANINLSDGDGQTALYWACSLPLGSKANLAGALGLVNLLLDHRADPNIQDKYGVTPLMQATLFSGSDIMRALLQGGADPNLCDHKGRTALAYAAKWDRMGETTRLLLDHRADPALAGHDGRQPLDIARENGKGGAEVLLAQALTQTVGAWSELAQAVFTDDLQALGDMLANGADPNVVERDGRSPLHIAVYLNRREMIEKLLQTGARANDIQRDRASPLHIAVERGYLSFLPMLLLAGAEIDARDEEGQTPLYRAVVRGDETATGLLLRHHADPNVADNSGKTPLHGAVRVSLHQSPCLVSQLIDAGAAVDCHDRYEQTPLHLLAKQSDPSVDVARRLIEAGVNVNAVRKLLGEITPLQLAAIQGAAELIRILIDADADLDWHDGEGQTALYKAVWKGWEDIVRDLLKAGADPRITTDKGEGLLHLAVREGHLKIAQYLVQQGLPINVRDNEGDTPLKQAVTYGRLELVKWLIDQGANPNIAGGSRGWTPLHVAAWNGRREIMALLLAGGADAEIQDKDGKAASQLDQRFTH